jgi:hypothetical protein
MAGRWHPLLFNLIRVQTATVAAVAVVSLPVAVGIAAVTAVGVGVAALASGSTPSASGASGTVTATIAAPGSEAISLGEGATVPQLLADLSPAPKMQEVRSGTVYRDSMMNYRTVGDAKAATEGSIKSVYMGEFRGFKYHGRGTMFLPDTTFDFLGSPVKVRMWIVAPVALLN